MLLCVEQVTLHILWVVGDWKLKCAYWSLLGALEESLGVKNDKRRIIVLKAVYHMLGSKFHMPVRYESEV